MRIEGLKLQNVRSYKDSIEIKDFSDVNTFIGPNTAGKSNILEALRYLRALSGIGESPRGFGEMVFDKDLDLAIRIELVVSMSNTERGNIIDTLFGHDLKLAKEVEQSPFLTQIYYVCDIQKNGVIGEEISIKNLVDGDLPIIRWRAERGKGAGGLVCESTDLDNRVSNQLPIQNIPPSLTEKGTFNPDFRILRSPSGLTKTDLLLLEKLRGFMLDWFWFPPVRQASPRMPLGEESVLLPSGTNLAKFLNTLQSQNPRKFVSLNDTVIEILPFVEEILAPTRGSEATVDVHEQGLKSTIDLANVSFGFMQILILIYGIVTSKTGSVILIEEPELHLHASSQRKLFELIQREGKHKQFFLTTHCSIFTGCSDKMRTFLITRHNGMTSVRQIQESSELKLVKAALGHRNTDLYGDECVVFIEGDSEEVAFPIISDALGYGLVERGIRLVNLKGSGKAKKIEEYLRYLKDSDVLAYVIADADKEVGKKLKDWEREGLLKEGCATLWPLEFEDCFDLEILAQAMNELSKEQNWNLSLTIEELKTRKEEGKSVVKTIQKLLHERDLPSLNKPALAEKIANILKEDIHASKERKKTLPEMEIEKIVNLSSPKKS